MTSEEKQQVISALEAAIRIVRGEWVPPKKCCQTCVNFDEGRCVLWPEEYVPAEVLNVGCPSWANLDIPF